MLRLLPALLIVLATAAPSSAQIFVSGGMGWPLSPDDVTELYGSGFGAGGGFVLENTAYPFARLRPQGVYQKFAIDPDQLQAFEEEIEGDSLDVDVTGGDMGIIFGGADLQLRLPYASFTPYIAPAVGVAYIAIDDLTIEGSGGTTTFSPQNEETAITFGLGAGLAFSLGDRFELFAEGHYMYALIGGSDNQSWMPARFGVVYTLEQW